MAEQFKYLVNRTPQEATLRLYGTIGEKIDGDYFAQEIAWLAESTDTIHIRINSPGGSILQGLSIVSAIVSAKAKVITWVDGIAASMAAVIAVSGHQVKMNDYAKLMIHDPYFTDEEGEKVKKLNDRDKRAIGAMKSILEGILKKRCKADTKIEDMMKAETWIAADDALSMGLVDEIIATGRNLGNLAPLQMVALLMDEVDKQNTKTMKDLTARLKLAEGADEQAIIQAVDQLVTDAKAPVTQLVEKLVDVYLLSGKAKETKETLVALAASDLPAFMAKIELKAEDFQKEQPVRLSDVIAEFQKNNKGSEPEKDWDWYQKNDPQALREMRNSAPDQYRKLYKAYWGEDLK